MNGRLSDTFAANSHQVSQRTMTARSGIAWIRCEKVLLNRICLLGLLSLVSQGQSHAAQNGTPLALVATSTRAEPVVACLAKRISPLLAPDQLSSGLEARAELHPSADGAQFSITLLLKPDVYSLLAGLDEDPEAHPVLQAALLGNLRHPIATRVYPWRNLNDCRAAADWLTGMTRLAIDMSPKK